MVLPFLVVSQGLWSFGRLDL